MGSVTYLPASTYVFPTQVEGTDNAEVHRAFLFRLSGWRQYALSSDVKGQSLPRGPRGSSCWTFIRAIDLIAGEWRVAFDTDEALRSLHDDGYALLGGFFGSR